MGQRVMATALHGAIDVAVDDVSGEDGEVFGDQPGVPGPLRLPGPRQLAVAEAAGRLTEGRRVPPSLFA
jgi:hypothetical protein